MDCSYIRQWSRPSVGEQTTYGEGGDRKGMSALFGTREDHSARFVWHLSSVDERAQPVAVVSKEFVRFWPACAPKFALKEECSVAHC